LIKKIAITRAAQLPGFIVNVDEVERLTAGLWTLTVCWMILWKMILFDGVHNYWLSRGTYGTGSDKNG